MTKVTNEELCSEVLDAVLPSLIKKLLGIDVVKMEDLPDDLQHTKERKPDLVKKITDKSGKEFALQLEWQKGDDYGMVFRMAEYYIMLLRRFRLPICQYVFYIGPGVPRMTDHLVAERMQFSYQMIIFSAIDYHLFLSANDPKEKMLAVLCNFGDTDPRQAVADITKGVFERSKGDLSKRQIIRQLWILSKMRNLDGEIKDIMESFAPLFTKEEDPFYQWGQKDGVKKGIEKGEARKTREIVRSLLLNTKHSVPEIARLVNVSESFVRRVKRSLQA